MRLIALGLPFIASACGGATSDVTVFGPSSERCATTASLDASTVPAAGGTATIAVTAARECEWAARADAAWVSLSPTTGSGNGTVRLTVASNPQFSTRTARVVVNDTGFDLIQAAAPAPPPPPDNPSGPTPPGAPPGPPPPAACTPEIDPVQQRFDAGGGNGRVRVEALAGCAWNASTDADWIAILSAPQGSGTGEIQYRVEPNRAARLRSGTITIAGRTHQVEQMGAPLPSCSYQLDLDERSFGAEGGTGAVRVQAASGCAWSASASASWIVLAADRDGSGTGEVQYRVERNTSTQPRSGAITIAGRTHHIRQAGAPPPAPSCSYALDPTERTFSPDGGTAAVRVQAGSGCDWSASASASWIVLAADRDGSGNGEVQYRIERNTSTQGRSGTITIAGRTHHIQQGGAPPPAPSCSYELDPAERAFSPDGGTAAVRVRVAEGCEWTASSNASWIVISSNGAGRGNGDVQYRVERNTSTQARTGTVTVAGRTHRVEQGGAPQPTPTCSYEIDPQQRSFATDGGTGGIRVRANAGCNWSASTTANWIVISSNAAGTGNGELQYRVERNGSTQARSATITIAGHTHRVEQSGAPEPAPTCTYQVDPPGRSFGPQGGSSEIRVRTQSGCRWTAAASVSWITITSSREGVGNGAIEYRVDPNTGSAARSGTVSIAGHTVHLTQNAR